MLIRFFHDREATVAPFLALALVPIVGLLGAAVDYSRANAARTAMQGALDSTALMLSKDAATLQAPELAGKANAYFSALFKNPDAKNVTISQQFNSPLQGSFSLKLTGSATVNTMFATLLGQSQIDISTSAEVIWGIKKLNLALVLDNTGSMSQNGKMDALKTAAHNLLTTLQNAAKTPGDVKVSIVPFATDTNIAAADIDPSFVDWQYWDAANGSCSKSKYHSKSSCTSNGGQWAPASHAAWNGCVMDRDQNNDVLATAPLAGATSTLFPAHQASSCPAALMPLSIDWSALNAKIDAMAPTGATNVTIGLTWGWQTLAPNGPFNAPAPAPDLDKVIILLTDGQNTQNRWGSSQTSIDARTQKACDNIKAANIRIYTVRVIDGNAALLKNCATNPDMYYDVYEASELNGVFSSIAQNLANLRIAK